MHRRFLAIILSALVSYLAHAQPLDDKGGNRHHRNELTVCLTGGHNAVSGVFMGEYVRYSRHLDERWTVGGGQQVQLFKQHYALDALGSYRIPLGKSLLFLDTHALMSRYHRWHTWEFVLNVSALWVANYGDIRLGLSYIHYWMDAASSYTEPPTITVGLGLNLKPRTSPWNIGLFVRNYDQYYYENWNLNWGIRFFASLQQNLKLLGEFNVRPAGNMSQLATRYETSLKLGLNYVW